MGLFRSGVFSVSQKLFWEFVDWVYLPGESVKAGGVGVGLLCSLGDAASPLYAYFHEKWVR